MQAVVLACLFISLANSHDHVPCDVRAWTEYGWVCGLRRWSEGGKIYASFRGVPYAKQPIGELRFKELQPPEPWKHNLDAREEGPTCPLHNDFYGFLSNEEYGMSESCIHVNIHVPINVLPKIHKSTNNNGRNPEITGHDLQKYLRIGGRGYVYTKEEKEYGFPLLKYKYNDYKYKLLKYPRYTYPNYYDNKYPFILRNEYQNHDTPDYQNILPNLHYYKDIGEYVYDIVKDEPKNDNDIISTSSNKGDETEPKYFRLKVKKDVNNASKQVPHKVNTTKLKEHEKTVYNNSKIHREKRESVYTYKKNYGEHEKLLPILVYIHGGGFIEGSGDADLNGPEYLVSKDVIVITFNYRLNVFGFLSLNTASVPGNNGLRDQITLLRWVQRNAKYFGGDPDNVTLMGQGGGATCAHLLSLSDAAKGLFKRLWLMSGTAYQAFYTTSPIYAANVKNSFLAILGITSKDPEEIYKELARLPIERIIEANSLLQAQYGLITFTPVVETKFPGVKTVLDKDPETLIAEGRGNDYPIVIGSTTDEAETFRRKLGYERFVSRTVANPRTLLPAGIPFLTPQKLSLSLGEKVVHRCFEGKPDLDGVVKCFTEFAFVYQAFRLARQRIQMQAAPTYLYRFSYEGDLNLIKKGLSLEYKGVGHIEDFTYVFRVNSLLEPRIEFPPKNRDDMMRDWMTAFVVNFMNCSDPTCHENSPKSGWPRVTKDHLVYEDIATPYVFNVMTPTHELLDMIRFYDEIYAVSGAVSSKQT